MFDSIEHQRAKIVADYAERELLIDQRCYDENNTCSDKCIQKGTLDFVTGLIQKRRTEASISMTMCGFDCDKKLRSCLNQTELEKQRLREEKERQLLALDRQYAFNKSNTKNVSAATENIPSKGGKKTTIDSVCDKTTRIIAQETYKNFLTKGVNPIPLIESKTPPGELDERISTLAAKYNNDQGRKVIREGIIEFKKAMEKSIESALSVSSSPDRTKTLIHTQSIPGTFDMKRANMMELAAINYWLQALGYNQLATIHKCIGGEPSYELILPQ